jgi:hypothetical protein
MTASKIERCAYSREPAMQTCPELKKIAPAAAAPTWAGSTSGITITGDLPPSSSVTRFKVSVALTLMILPTSVETAVDRHHDRFVVGLLGAVLAIGSAMALAVLIAGGSVR